jgi:hypothetical protein
VREAAATIESNARFVLGELDGIDVADDWRLRVKAVWREFGAASERIRSMATRGEAGDMPHAFDEIEWLQTSLARMLRALDDLVRALETASQQDVTLSLLAILVNESGANTVRACAVLQQAVQATRAGLRPASPSLREEAGLPEGAELIRRLPCSVCGRTAVTFEAGIDSLSGRRALILGGLVRRETVWLYKAGEIFEDLAQGRIGAIHVRLGGEGLDAYCPACDRAYCGDHYLMLPEYDEGFYDCTRGICPEGHKRLVDD